MRFWFNIFQILLWFEVANIYNVNSKNISPKLKTLLEKEGIANVYVSFGNTTPALAEAKSQRSFGGSPAEKAKIVRESLLNLANSDQLAVFNMLQAQRSLTPTSQMKYEKMWLSNRLYIRNANFDLVNQIANMSNVTQIAQEAISTIDDTVAHSIDVDSGPDNGPTDYTYGLKKIQVPEAWEVLGGPEKAGEGVLVGVADTGCNVNHEAIEDNFVGGEYGYFAPNKDAEIEKENIPSHGTHVTGTILGKKGIGVAPAAKHVQCQGCLNAKCSEYGLEKCLQFFICPTKADGSDPDCSKRVHVINMSLQNLASSDRAFIDAAIAAGIILVSISGNAGPLCYTNTYPGLFRNVISTGSTDETDNISRFSGSGPTSWKPVYDIKPDVVGPGSNVLSANYDASKYKYILMNGTSMAAPHLTGLVALLLTRDKTLTQDQVRKLIIENTDRNLTLNNSWWCDGNDIPEGTYPNSRFGYGRINALKAINAQTKMLTGKK